MSYTSGKLSPLEILSGKKQPLGQHTVTVKGWDKNGAFWQSANTNVQ